MKRTKQNHRAVKRQRQEMHTREFNGLPRALTATESINAREFELKAMERAISNATEFTGTQRVFQTIPRHLRRRQASANVKRLPTKYRQRAISQMELHPVHNPIKSRKIRRRPQRLIQDMKRKDGAPKWLETHLWHAKRMKMVDKWGYKLALKSNQKSRRFAYRTAKNQAMINDTSYINVIEIKGSLKTIAKAFELISDPSMPSVTAPKYINGQRRGELFLHQKLAYPNKTVAHISFLWDKSEANKKLWVWVHPHSFQIVFKLLAHSLGEASGSLTEFDFNSDYIPSLIIQDDWILKPFDSEFIQFEFIGPKSHQLLAACLTLSNHGNFNQIAHQIWDGLKYCDSPTVFPPGTIFSLTVEDPRICFPKFMVDRNTISNEEIDKQSILVRNIPEAINDCRLMVDEERAKAVPLVKMNEINDRRRNAEMPGAPLLPTENDVKIPVMILHRGQTAYRGIRSDSQVACGWNFMAPKDWGIHFWRLFIYAGARAGSLQSRNSIHLENGLPCYPFDYPETTTFVENLKQEAKDLQKKYDNTPKARRTNFLKKGVKQPFRPGFEYLDLNMDTFKPLVVLHSSPMVELVQVVLNENHDTFEEFKLVLLERIKKSLCKREVLPKLKNLCIDMMNNWCVRVFIEFKRGRVEPNSRIHYLKENEDNVLDSKIDDDKLIGYTTSGGFSLALSKSSAIGCCSMKRLYLARKEGDNIYVRTRGGRLSHSCKLRLIE